MTDKEIGLRMYEKATDFVNKRFPMGWGGNVKIAVTNPKNEIIFKTLDEISHCYWGNAFPKSEWEDYDNQ